MQAPAPILGSMKPDGSRLMLHPADVKGRWIRARRIVFGALIAFYVLAPFVPVGGHPMIQLDVQHRRFYLFGNTFNAQDFWLVLLFALTVAFGLLLVTAWRGRVWCGWACPQTVFLEGVYRPIERLIDGPREKRLKLASEPMSAGKAARRLVKYLAFFVVSLVIAHTATALFVSPRELWLMIEDGPSSHWEAFFLTAGFTAILTFNFTWFREQFCVVLCPYGRLQSVLHDRDSVTVSYNEARGEPRGKLVKNPPPGAPKQGDCIDCKRCVVVCPTGIDIRNGLQMECLACNQCVDACDEVMDRIGKPRGLVGFASQSELAGQPRRVLRPRVLVYGALMALSIVTLVISLATRTPFEANVFRPRGANPFIVDGATVRNPFQVHLFNKNPGPATFHLSLTAPVPADVVIGTPDVELPSLSDTQVPVSVSIDKAHLGKPVDLVLEVKDDASGVVRQKTIRFLAPLGIAP
ncbi:MAG: cytochrome c oxidase accessory protein CcoG [Myxococcota bacterium]